jgi:ABC-2 type transport system ATP-binding protein
VVTVSYRGEPPEITGLPGIDTAESRPGQLRFTLTGPPGPALRALANADITSIEVREPGLEEIFLEFYGDKH